jgi:glycosyltransferase involved in cell wall biosynthesis
LPERRAVFAVPGDAATLTGGYGYARRVLAGLHARGRDTVALRLPDGFPDPSPRALDEAYAALAAQPEGVPLLVDGLALGAMPEVARAIGPRRPLVALVHHPLALETGVDPRRADALRASERAALAAARRVIATSRTTAAALVADYGVPAERIAVAPPGTDPVARPGTDPVARPGTDPLAGMGPAAGAGTIGAAPGGGEAARASDARSRAGAPLASGPIRLLSVGTPVPRKGHDVLLDALHGLGDAAGADWTLSIVGDPTRDPAHARLLAERAAAPGLAGRVCIEGALDAAALDALWARADVFVLASRHEGWGMAYAEALARGLPVIGTTAGAIPEVVPAAAGWLVAPGDAAALRQALREAIGDPTARAMRAAAARIAGAALPRWDDAVATIDAVLDAAMTNPRR